MGRGQTPHVTPHVQAQIERLLRAVEPGPLSREQLLERLGLSDRKHLREQYLQPAIAAGLVEMTIPASPRSTSQRYRLTAAGLARLAGKQS